MSKANKLYKIFMTSMIVIIAGLLLACGVIAVKNSMRVKMSIPANPNFLIEIYIQKDGSEIQNLVFKNYDEIKIQNGISGINANTLIASDDFITRYGGDFSIIIKNYTTTMGILASITSTATMDGDVPGVPAEITAVKAIAAAYDAVVEEAKFQIANKAVLPQQTLLEIKLEELKTLDVSFSGENTSTGDSNATIDYGSAYSQTFTAQDGYAFDSSITVTGVEEGGYSWTPSGQTGVFTITDWSKVTGPISINVNAVQNTYTITFDTTSLQAKVDGINQEEITVSPGATLNVTLASMQEGFSVHSVAGMSGNDIYDRYTGTLTLNDIQSDLTISASEVRPWTYGTYGSGHAWEGYKYINFANHETSGESFVDSNSNKISMNWVIVGAGANVNSTLSGVASDKLPATAFGGTLNSRTGENTDNLGDNHVLLFSQYTLTTKAYNSSYSENCGWSGSDLRDYLNGAFLTDSGLSAYASYIKSDNTIITAWNNADNVATNQSVFLLAYYGHSSIQSFCDQTYFSDSYEDARYTDFKGANNNMWWQRSGGEEYSDDIDGVGYLACYVSDDGTFANPRVVSISGGVRPAFVLNLA